MSHDQSDLARSFVKGIDSFDYGLQADPNDPEFHGLEGSLAHIKCHVRESLDVGDHTVHFANVVDSVVSKEPCIPLVYHNQTYAKLQPVT
jgi:flavin reductase (DIM6/NTAB) family NADH-FMN oxidoreductase RutF